MKPLIVLLGFFAAASVVFKLTSGNWHTTVTGNFALSVMLLFTATGHVKYTYGMSMMLPGLIPFKKAVIYVTGVLEIALAAGFLFPRYRLLAGVAFVIFLILALPANIRSAFLHINYETGARDGRGPAYLWFRVPMQLFLLLWVFYFSIRDHFPKCFYSEDN
ncbi:hypothetical protein KJK34_03060 [Flavobacterium sp. D11R37]|uniref:DoxX family protein n=1 Tax=Flavobacterium coralii TaxID=2838017 RepID=UPI001CA661CC|nr:hypothetical protein [Flavobacterium coralii]MBY8961725.1 hypothetical protein [Flavobacterium coralii]